MLIQEDSGITCTSFKMADNNVSDSDSSWEECAYEGQINPTEEDKKLGVNLATPKKLK